MELGDLVGYNHGIENDSGRPRHAGCQIFSRASHKLSFLFFFFGLLDMLDRRYMAAIRLP